MKMISLKLLVDMKYINKIKVLENETDRVTGDLTFHTFEVGSAEFEEKKNWIVKGDYLIEEDVVDRANILVVDRLEKDIEITIGKPTIVADDLKPEDESKLEELINTPVTAVVFHRELLISSARETQKKFVTAYAEACIDAYQKTNPSATREDFAVIEVDWSNKHIELKSVAPLVDNSVDNEKEENE